MVCVVPRNLIIHMKRFDHYGNKLINHIDCPLQFSFKKEYMNEALAKNES